MGTINTIQGLLFSNPLASQALSDPASIPNNINVPATFDGAFELTLSQQTNADGSSNDDVSFEAYTTNSGGGNASVLGATGTGGNAQSAFGAMLANLNGLEGIDAVGSAGTDSPDTIAAGTQPDWTNIVTSLFDELTAGLGSSAPTSANAGSTNGNGNTTNAAAA